MEGFKTLSLNEIEVISNTREDFNENGLKELSASIKANGVIEPIIVKFQPSGKYRLICGERRFRASLLAGKPDIPAFIKDIDDGKILQVQIVENLQRRNLTPMEEITAMVRLRDEESMSHQEIAKAIGKALSHVEKQFCISRAAMEVHDALARNQVTRQVALIISGLDTQEKQIRAVNALKRERVEYLVKAKDAENYVNSNFGAQPKKQSFGHSKPSAGRFAGDWKYYLVRFSADQFKEFQSIVKTQTETGVWADAVETVMNKQ